MIQHFAKYKTQGAYHWRSTSATAWYRRDVVLAAKYELVIDALGDLERAVGLDVGTGDGVFLHVAAQRHIACFGIEGWLPGALHATERLAAHGTKGRVAVGDAMRIPVATESVDFSTCLDVIEHVVDSDALVTELARVVKPGGRVVMTTPLARADGLLQDPFHVREFTREDLQRDLSRHLTRVTVRYYNPAWLLDLHRGVTRLRWIDRLARVALRTPSLFGINLFKLLGLNDTRGEALIAVGEKPTAAG